MTKRSPLDAILTDTVAADPSLARMFRGLGDSFRWLAEQEAECRRALAARTPEQVEADERRMAEARARYAAADAEARARDAREAAARQSQIEAAERRERLAAGVEAAPEWASVEGFVEYALGEERETFSGADVRRLAAGAGMAPADVRAALESYGLRFEARRVGG